ncbi:MAG: hypothetical protein P8X74_20895 [Reinekea sp.]
MLPKNFNEPMGAPAIFEKQIEIKLLPPASTLKSRIQVDLTIRLKRDDLLCCEALVTRKVAAHIDVAAAIGGQGNAVNLAVKAQVSNKVTVHSAVAVEADDVRAGRLAVTEEFTAHIDVAATIGGRDNAVNRTGKAS